MKKTLPINLLLCVICIACSNNSKTIVNGILPKGYEWAYGEWQGKDYDGAEVNLFIGDNYIQNNEPYIRASERIVSDAKELPSIVCFPKLNYWIEETSDNEINLYYEGAWGYEESITLTKNKKTVEGYSKTKKRYNTEKAVVLCLD